MNICASSGLPVCPEYIFSQPYCWYPHWCNSCAIICTGSMWSNGVASLVLPLSTATLPEMHSMSCPTVIRLGMHSGFMMMSGVIPSRVNGMSSCLHMNPQVPFCAMRLANLSPISGMRTSRTRILTNLSPSWFVESMTESTTPLVTYHLSIFKAN